MMEIDMLKPIPNLPENALGFSAHAVTGTDYEDVLIPAVEEKLAKFQKIRFLYHMGEGFTGYDVAAMWNDAKIGLKHLRSWERCAIVIDVEWIRITTKAFGFIFPGKFRLFHNHEFQTAFDWICRASMLMIFLLLSGFTLMPSLIPQDDILSGGPPKDGIPALSFPKIESGRLADAWLNDTDRILGIVVNGHARAYPIRILNWHEIVNDRIGKQSFVITYCPLCGSGMAFDTRDQFGVSGLLYQSDVLLYDKKTETLWSQLMMQAVAGPRMGEILKLMQLTHTTWKAWYKQHPNTAVLSRHTGYNRDYSRDPYGDYGKSRAIYFPIRNRDERLHPKTWVIGLELDGASRAWKISTIRKVGEIQETWNHHKLLIRNRKGVVDIVDTLTGKPLKSVILYWFAWATFHPDTTLYTSSDK